MSDADDRQLLRRWHDNGDEGAREELVERTLPLARFFAPHLDDDSQNGDTC